MVLNHVGVVNSTAEEAERFYGDFFGMTLIKDYIVSPTLSDEIFAVPEGIRMMAFGMGEYKIEVFIHSHYRRESPAIAHFGLLVDNFDELLKRADEQGVALVVGSDKEKTVYFVKDFSGNMIEIKQSS
jgi:catechol 2,3-dioxygenase-like lactoylglutathione lyase family enzyme